MFTEKFFEVLNKEGVVSIVTCSDNKAHVINSSGCNDKYRK